MGSTFACCFGTGFCSLCCSACPSCKGSTSTRLVYSVFLFACLTIFFIMLTPSVRDILRNESHLQENSTNNCSYSGGFRAVYRLSLGTTIFFGLLSILVSKDERMNEIEFFFCSRWSKWKHHVIDERKFRMDFGQWNFWFLLDWSVEHFSFMLENSMQFGGYLDWLEALQWVNISIISSNVFFSLFSSFPFNYFY